MNKKKLWVLIFGFLLVLFAIFTTKVGFHDSYEYVSVAKYFGGINNVDLFSTHSILYPAVIGVFLRVVPNMLMIKLLNVLWIFLIGLVLLYKLDKKIAFVLFATSPLTWYISVQTTPILPASLFFLLAYVFIKEDNKFSRFFSGVCLGLSFAFYTPMLLVGGIFVLAYFWKEKLSQLVMYLIFFGVGVLPRFVLEYFFMGNPLYSLIRYFGSNFLVSLGMNPNISGTQLSNLLGILIIFIGISPLLFKLYKTKFNEYGKEIVFLSLSAVILLVRTAELKYFLVLSPILLILLSEVLTKKDIEIHGVLSIILICFLCFGFFGQTKDVLIKQDLDNVVSEYDGRQIVAGPFEANNLASLVWSDEPYFYWFMDYDAYVNNETKLKSYSLNLMPKIPIREKIVFTGDFIRADLEKSYKDVLIVSENQGLEGFKQIKCYEVLCVYE